MWHSLELFGFNIKLIKSTFNIPVSWKIFWIKQNHAKIGECFPVCAFLKCVVISGGMCENRKENWWAMHINRQQGTSILSPNLDRYLLLDYWCLQGVVAYVAEIQWHSGWYLFWRGSKWAKTQQNNIFIKSSYQSANSILKVTKIVCIDFISIKNSLCSLF